ncbi:MAG TPA: PEGA domain-containing protein [Bryobacteraceae bacterium]|nr:PEGA domain-containing protein [Bryobacteraceae bacterium]
MRIILSLIIAFCLPLSAQSSGNGSLAAKVNPGRAGVFVDGKYFGPAANFRVARTYSLPAGEHEVRLVDPRYQEFVTKVNIEAGKKLTLRQNLTPVALAKPPFGRLRTVSADKFAAVYVNEKYCGHADEFSNFAQGLLLNPGEYDVKIVPAAGTPVVAKVKIEADKVSIVR